MPIRLDHLIVLAGLFGMSCEELVFILLRNKKSVSKEGKWYIEGIRSKYEDK